MIRRLALPCLLLAAAAVASGCGTKDEDVGAPAAQQLDLMLDFYPNADHAGIYGAMASGEFRRAGLDVRLRVPGDPSTPLKLLSAGKVDLAISYEPELMLARDKGAELVSIAAMVQRPLTSIMSLAEGFRRPADMEGHTVGTAGIPYQTAYLKTILEDAGADPARVKQVDVGFDLVPAMLSKKVHATLGAFWNYEGIQLKLRGRDPTIIPVDQAGVPTYDELIIVAREETAREQAALLRRFVQALARGHEALREGPEQALDALLEANPDLDREHQAAVVEATLPVFFPEDAGRPWGWHEPRDWAAYARWMQEEDLLDRRPIPHRSYTNELLPGEGFDDEG